MRLAYYKRIVWNREFISSCIYKFYSSKTPPKPFYFRLPIKISWWCKKPPKKPGKKPGFQIPRKKSRGGREKC